MAIDTIFDVVAASTLAPIPAEPRLQPVSPNPVVIEQDVNADLNATRANEASQPNVGISETASASDTTTTALAPEAADSTSSTTNGSSTDATPPPDLADMEAQYLSSLNDLLGPDPNAASPANDVSDHVNILA